MRTPVSERVVLYVPGYDDEAATRYRKVFIIGMAQARRRFGLHATVGPVDDDDAIPAQRWRAVACGGGWRTETSYEVLRWDDIVRRDLGRNWRERFPLLVLCLSGAIRDGVITGLFRVDWHFASLVVWPWWALLWTVIAGAAIGWLAAAGLAAATASLPAPLEPIIALVIAAAIIGGVQPLLRRAYIYHLLDDWIFNWQHGTGRRTDIDARLDRFAERVRDAVRDAAAAGAQEVLIVGHSTGSILAVEVVARALDLDPELGGRGPLVSLLTIGAELPVVGYLRKAERFREAIIRLATCPSLLWIEYQAPQDWWNSFRFDPVRDLRLDLGGRPRTNPHIRSPRFGEALLPSTYQKIRWNFLRVHFQFLMPVDKPGEYDYPMIACGPVTLLDRVLDPAAAVQATYGSLSPATNRQGAKRQRA